MQLFPDLSIKFRLSYKNIMYLENTHIIITKNKVELRILFDYSLQVQYIYNLIEVTKIKRLNRHDMHVQANDHLRCIGREESSRKAFFDILPNLMHLFNRN